MLLVREENELPTKNARGGSNIRETYRELLQENSGTQGKLGTTKAAIGIGTVNSKMR